MFIYFKSLFLKDCRQNYYLPFLPTGSVLRKSYLRMYYDFQTCRSSRPEVFCKKSVLRNFTKFTGKQLCQSLFLIKLQPVPESLF